MKSGNYTICPRSNWSLFLNFIFTSMSMEALASCKKKQGMKQANISMCHDSLFQPFYFHVNGSIGIVQKIEFKIRPDLRCTTFKTSRKVVLDNPSECLSVCRAVSFSANSHGRKGKPIELKLKGAVRLHGALRRTNFCGDSSTRL